MIFMTHPEHGANNVSESDVAEQENHGWKVTSRAEWMGKKAAPVNESAPVTASAPVRRGRPPKDA